MAWVAGAGCPGGRHRRRQGRRPRCGGRLHRAVQRRDPGGRRLLLVRSGRGGRRHGVDRHRPELALRRRVDPARQPELLQVGAQVAQRRPLPRLGVEALAQQAGEGLRHLGEVVLAAAHTVHHGHGRTAAVGGSAGRRERDGGRPRVHVGGGRRVVAVEDLGRQVARRAQQEAGLRQPRVLGDPSETEVDQDRRAALHQHVGRLDVAVQHARGVHRLQRLGEGFREVEQVAPGDRPLLRHVVVERESGHVARDDVRRGPGRVGVDDLGDTGAGDAPQRAHLAREPLARLAVADHVGTQHLQGDPAAVVGLGEVHDAHATLADAGEQSVGPDAVVARSGGRLGHGAHRTTVAGARPSRLAVVRHASGRVRRPGASSRSRRRRGRTGCRRGPAGSRG